MINLNTNNRIVLTNNLFFAIIFLKMDVEKFATHLKVCTVCMYAFIVDVCRAHEAYETNKKKMALNFL